MKKTTIVIKGREFYTITQQPEKICAAICDKKKKCRSFARLEETLPEKVPLGGYFPGTLFLGIQLRQQIFLLKLNPLDYKLQWIRLCINVFDRVLIKYQSIYISDQKK